MKVLPITNNNQINKSKQLSFKAGKILIKNSKDFPAEVLKEFTNNPEFNKLAQELSKKKADLIAQYGRNPLTYDHVVYLNELIDGSNDSKTFDYIYGVSKDVLASKIKKYNSADSLPKIEFNKSVDETKTSDNQKSFWKSIKNFLKLS